MIELRYILFLICVLGCSMGAQAQYYSSERILTDSIPNLNSVHAVDLDQDGKIDIVASSELPNDVFWYQQNDSLGFIRHHIISLSETPTINEIVDVDFDGDLDLIGNLNQGAYWWENDGSESFTSHFISSYYTHFAGDFDSDGDFDFGAIRSDSLLLLDNQGAGIFAVNVVDVGLYFSFAKVEDMDGDGDLDVVAAGGNRIYWFKNTNAIFERNTLTTLTQPNPVATIRDFEIIDFDSDGDNDVLTVGVAGYDCHSCRVYWIKNEGNGVFQKSFLSVTFGAAIQHANEIEVNDFDSDGDLDVLVAQEAYKIFYNRGDNTFVMADASQYADYLATVDIDQDLDLDLITSNTGIGYVGWKENLLIRETDVIDEFSAGFVLRLDSLDRLSIDSIAGTRLYSDNNRLHIEAGVDGGLALQQRGSQIAGSNLTWDGDSLNISQSFISGAGISWDNGWYFDGDLAGQSLLWDSLNNQLELNFEQLGTFRKIDTATIAFEAQNAASTNVVIGDTLACSQYMIAIRGALIAERLKIDNVGDGWPDYVFEDEYELKPLEEIEKYIAQNGHLPGIDSEEELRLKGLDFGDFEAFLLKNIEELTLYILRREKTLVGMEEKIKQLTSQREEIKKLIDHLKSEGR